ncbi:MAG: hypothetical protein M3380_08225, partial [Chloroflexota bacterium]|nr:hypothetical protein [Chloroflexota bacterium]
GINSAKSATKLINNPVSFDRWIGLLLPFMLLAPYVALKLLWQLMNRQNMVVGTPAVFGKTKWPQGCHWWISPL